jgi:hypothetical protein
MLEGMTSMSSPGFGQYPGEPVGFVEQRTSVMAILSLVFSLICFIPGFALLGALFGIASLVAIARSGERLGGRGLAIAGLILSLIVLAVQGGAVIGTVGIWKLAKTDLIKPAAETMAAVEAQDYAKARVLLTPESAKKVTDADVDAFRQDYQAELGKFVSIPNTPMSLIHDYGLVEQQMQQIGGRNDTIPLPAQFENGTALLVFQIIPGTSKIITPSTNVVVIAPSGNKWTLFDPQRGTGGAAPKPPDKPAGKPGEASPPKEPGSPG